MLRLVLIFGLLIFLYGCLGDHGRMGAMTVEPRPTYAPLSSPTVSPDQLAKSVEEIKSTVQSSTNAAQQSFSGLGAQIAKGAENVEASVARLQADVRVNAQANAEANVRLNGRVEAMAEIVNDLKVNVGLAVEVANRVDLDVKAQASAIADLKMQINALAAAQVGYKNQLEQTTTSLESGRDTFMQVNGISREMVQMLKDEKDTQVREAQITAIVVIVIVIALLEFSRRRAEQRAKEAVARRGAVRQGEAGCGEA